MSRTGLVLLLAPIIGTIGCSENRVYRVDPSGGSGSSSSSTGAVSISPPSETLRIGGQRQFSGWDSSAGQYEVTWKLQEGEAAGKISATGVYTAPATAGLYHLIATSSHDPSLSATAPLSIVNVGFATIPPMHTARFGHTATLLLDGRVLVAGGTSDSVNSAEVFDAKLGGFIATSGPMVQVRAGHCASLLQDGRVLIAGGRDSTGGLLTAAELFNPETGLFSATGNLNEPRRFATATLLVSGKVLLAGGQDSAGNVLSSAELYDPASGTFSMTGSLQTARAQHTATLLASGKVLLLGNLSATGAAELFDPASGTFSTTGSLNQARTHHAATLLQNGKVLVTGGTQIMEPDGGGAAAAPVSLDTAEIYDPSAGVFENAGKLTAARDSHSATLLQDGTVLLAGGYVHDFDGDANSEWYSIFTAERFDPNTMNSSAAASLEGDRAEHLATLLGSGQVLITGGITGGQELCCSPQPWTSPLGSAEVYRWIPELA